MNNPIYKFLQSLPTNGYTTAIGAVASIGYGIFGLASGQVDLDIAIGFIIAGWTALGIGSKQDKISKAVSESPPIAG